MNLTKEQKEAGVRMIERAYARAARIKAKVEEAMAKQESEKAGQRPAIEPSANQESPTGSWPSRPQAPASSPASAPAPAPAPEKQSGEASLLPQSCDSGKSIRRHCLTLLVEPSPRLGRPLAPASSSSET